MARVGGEGATSLLDRVLKGSPSMTSCTRERSKDKSIQRTMGVKTVLMVTTVRSFLAHTDTLITFSKGQIS